VTRRNEDLPGIDKSDGMACASSSLLIQYRSSSRLFAESLSLDIIGRLLMFVVNRGCGTDDDSKEPSLVRFGPPVPSPHHQLALSISLRPNKAFTRKIEHGKQRSTTADGHALMSRKQEGVRHLRSGPLLIGPLTATADVDVVQPVLAPTGEIPQLLASTHH